MCTKFEYMAQYITLQVTVITFWILVICVSSISSFAYYSHEQYIKKITKTQIAQPFYFKP